jgi:hypothetical protein
LRSRAICSLDPKVDCQTDKPGSHDACVPHPMRGFLLGGQLQQIPFRQDRFLQGRCHSLVRSPFFDFTSIGVHRPQLVMLLSVNRQCLPSLPPLHSSDVSFQVSSNFFPGFEPVGARIRAGMSVLGEVAHTFLKVLRLGKTRGGSSSILNLPHAKSNREHGKLRHFFVPRFAACGFNRRCSKLAPLLAG